MWRCGGALHEHDTSCNYFRQYGDPPSEGCQLAMSPHRLLPSLQDRCDQWFRWTSPRAAHATADRFPLPHRAEVSIAFSCRPPIRSDWQAPALPYLEKDDI